MNISEDCYKIKDGPNKEKLLDKSKYVYNKDNCNGIKFVVALYHKGVPGGYQDFVPMIISDMRITSVKCQNESEESYNLEGTCIADLKSLFVYECNLEKYRFNANYNAKTRKGVISFSA